MTESSGPESRIMVWAVSRERLGLARSRVLLDIRPGKVRLIDPNVRARILQILPPVFAALLVLAIERILLIATASNVVLLVVSVLGLGILFVAGVLPYAADYIWSFMLTEPRGTFDADVVETSVGNAGDLFIHLRVHHTDRAPAPAGGPSTVTEFVEDRWVAVRHRKRVLAALGGARGPSGPAS